MFMKTKNQQNPIPGKGYAIHYLHTHRCYSPNKFEKGIHCSSESFDYIVEWQVQQEIQQYLLTNNLYGLNSWDEEGDIAGVD